MGSGTSLIHDLIFGTWIILLLSGVVFVQSGVASPINAIDNQSPWEPQNSHETVHLSTNKKSAVGESPVTPQSQSNSTDNRSGNSSSSQNLSATVESASINSSWTTVESGSINSSLNQNTSVTVDPVSVEESVINKQGLKLIQGTTTSGNYVNVTAETIDIVTISENTSSQSNQEVVFKNISKLEHNNTTEVYVNNEVKTVRFGVDSDKLNVSSALVVAKPVPTAVRSVNSANNIVTDEPDQEADTNIEFLTVNSGQNPAELSSFNSDSSEDSDFDVSATIDSTSATITVAKVIKETVLVVFRSEDTTKLALMRIRGPPSAIETATDGDMIVETTPDGDIQVDVEQVPTEDSISDSPIVVFQVFPIQSSLWAALSFILGWMYGRRKKLEELVISYTSGTDREESGSGEDATTETDPSEDSTTESGASDER